MDDLRQALSSLDAIEAPDIWLEVERRAAAPAPGPSRGAGRSQTIHSVTKFVVAGAIVAILSSGAGLSARLFYSSGDMTAAAAIWNLGNELAVFAVLVLVVQYG